MACCSIHCGHVGTERDPRRLRHLHHALDTERCRIRPTTFCICMIRSATCHTPQHHATRHRGHSKLTAQEATSVMDRMLFTQLSLLYFLPSLLSRRFPRCSHTRLEA